MTADPRYPIGPFVPKPSTTPAEREALIRDIAEIPDRLRQAVDGLDAAQLDTPYRDGGWTVRQVVHHVPDSHMNGYTRLKLAMTEELPTIQPYDQAAWAQIADVKATPITVSLALLDNLHQRWTTILTSLDDAAFRRPLVHPQHGRVTIDWLLQIYAWHGKHHVAHINSLRSHQGW